MVFKRILNWLFGYGGNENNENNENQKKELILEKKYSNIILSVSFLFGLNSIYGLYNYIYNDMQFVYVLVTNTLLFITSINYWRKPVCGFRRNIDMVLCAINILYNPYMISHCNNAYIGVIPMKCIIIFYALSWIYHNKNRKYLGVFWHCMSQLAGNIGNFAILSGFFKVPIHYVENNGLQYYYQLDTPKIAGLITFILYTSIYLTSIYCSHITKMITPINYKKSVNHGHELVTYFISTIHALFTGIFGLYYCINYSYDNAILLDIVFSVSIGYYASDIIYLFITCNNDYKNIISFLVHHLMSISCLLYQLSITNENYKTSSAYIGARLYLAEFSVIPLNYIWYLKNTDDNYKINIRYVTAFEAIFRLFFVFRIINYSELIIRLFDEEYIFIYNPLKIAVIILTILNYVWFYKIYQIKKAVKKNYLEHSTKIK